MTLNIGDDEPPSYTVHITNLTVNVNVVAPEASAAQTKEQSSAPALSSGDHSDHNPKFDRRLWQLGWAFLALVLGCLLLKLNGIDPVELFKTIFDLVEAFK